MKRSILLACLICCLCSSAIAFGEISPLSELPDGTRYVTNRVIIMLCDSNSNIRFTSQAIEALNAIPGIVRVEPFYKGNLSRPALKRLASKLFRVILDNGYDARTCLNRFLEIPAVKFAEMQAIPELFYVPNDPYIQEQWHLAKTSTFQAWDYVRGDTTKHSIIGIIDTGINYEHNDIEPNNWINQLEDINHNGEFDFADIDGVDDDSNGLVDDVVGWNFAADNNMPIDAMGHGTGVASCASEATDNDYLGAGAGFSARLMGLKGINDGGQLIEGYICMLYAADNGAQIVNCSWGIPVYSEIEQNIINAAWEEDVLIIAAGGNMNQLTYPAAYDHVVAVSATDQDDHITPFAPWGEYIDICAPGLDIPLIWGNTYLVLSGTSFAAGIVSGITALVRAWYPSYTNEQIWQVIADAADPIDDINPGHQGELGAGRINAANCVMTGIDNKPTLPSGTELISCYPNPFNPVTTIKYELAKPSEVTIDIYDILGRKVESLKPGLQQAGSRSITWDAGGLPSGVYFAKLMHNKESAILKMILLK